MLSVVLEEPLAACQLLYKRESRVILKRFNSKDSKDGSICPQCPNLACYPGLTRLQDESEARDPNRKWMHMRNRHK